MGKWAKNLFGYDQFSDVGIVVAGTIKPDMEKKILKFFDGILSRKDSVYHAYLGRKNKENYPIVFNVYGAPAMMDVITFMHDGGCRTIIFIGNAYGGFRNLKIGEIVLPYKSCQFQGVCKQTEPEKEESSADEELRGRIEKIFKKNYINTVNGINISVPSITFQLKHDNPSYKKINPMTVEMELSSCLSRGKEMGMRAAGILIINDNRNSAIKDDEKRKARDESKMKIMRTIISNIDKFKFAPIKVDKEFNIDEHLAGIIESPEDSANIYKENKERKDDELKEARSKIETY